MTPESHAKASKSKWIKDRKPEDGQSILARFKHGIIACSYDKKNDLGSTYIWHDLEFYIYEWMPLEDFERWARGEL